MRELEGSRTPQEDLQSQLTWDHGVSQSIQELDLDPIHIYSKYLAWCSCGSPNKQNGGCLGLCSLPLDPLPLAGLPGWTSVGEDVPSLAGTRFLRVWWYPYSKEKGRGQWKKGRVRMGLGREEGVCDWDVK